MEPIPQTARAIAEFGPFAIEDEDLLTELLDSARRVRDLVPTCVGLSVASNIDEVTFTVVATTEEIALLDAVQYVAGGPCVEAVKSDHVLTFDHDRLDEEEWRLFAHATAAVSVASTLTLPILGRTGGVAGSVNLYASSSDAFAGQHAAIAAVFDAWAPGAVTNADLSFSTRSIAESAPDLLREDVDLTIACTVIADDAGISFAQARRRLIEAAHRAGVTEAQLARTVIELRRPRGDD